MARRILVPYDGTPQSLHALEYAVEEYDDATVAVLHVIDPLDAGHHVAAGIPSYAEEWYEAQLEDTEQLFTEAKAVDAEVETVSEIGRPARTIVEYIEDHDVDHVVIGSHGRSGVSRILLGSVAELVVRRSPVPVTVVR